jgi:glucokinase
MPALLGIDLGGTKLALAIFDLSGNLLQKDSINLNDRYGAEVGLLIRTQTRALINQNRNENPIVAIGIAIPGIVSKLNTIWAPNIPGWEDYPLLEEIKSIAPTIPVIIESDRNCYILGEMWQGNARTNKTSIYLAVGTGIGAGICIDGKIFQGAHGSAGSIGWMGYHVPSANDQAAKYPCLEYEASGAGIARVVQKILQENGKYNGLLRHKPVGLITAYDVFAAHEMQDEIAQQVISSSIDLWGLTIANLVSFFDPEKIILGGGIFGPAIQFIPRISARAATWAQPVSFKQVIIEASLLGADAGIYGAAFLALKKINSL